MRSQLRWCDEHPERNRLMTESKTLTEDPVCGMSVDKATALYDEHDGEIFYFCSYFCRHEFLAASSGTNLAEKSESSRA